ncbi:hypothetical protein L249_1897 [Ophiocordyceps polyrhachis-furcata BCC 54312]|uniref:Uncharacterized protein n=1 Tax=Ophiocordyceps polyrhachis-furcata BCC 54312 TaxID=1330021 RepID=A0A367LRL4_9HYPO|nr:hypothetical protein L249_1897 [Ophiocordyceps polyrhachis-furcata BCC 54312]
MLPVYELNEDNEVILVPGEVYCCARHYGLLCHDEHRFSSESALRKHLEVTRELAVKHRRSGANSRAKQDVINRLDPDRITFELLTQSNIPGSGMQMTRPRVRAARTQPYFPQETFQVTDCGQDVFVGLQRMAEKHLLLDCFSRQLIVDAVWVRRQLPALAKYSPAIILRNPSSGNKKVDPTIQADAERRNKLLKQDERRYQILRRQPTTIRSLFADAKADKKRPVDDVQPDGSIPVGNFSWKMQH